MSSNISALDQAQAVTPTPAPGFSHPSSHLSVSTTNTPSKELIKTLANLIAEKGVVVGAIYAADYHKSLNQANPPTADELMLRVVDAPANLGKEKFDQHFQGLSNAMALRFLAANAGPGYPFEKAKT